AELAHVVEEIRVAGEIDGLRARDDVADRVGRGTERSSLAVVRRRDGTYLELADRKLLAYLDLHDGLEPPLSQQPTQPAGDDDRQLLSELLQRGQVEMVVVRV